MADKDGKIKTIIKESQSKEDLYNSFFGTNYVPVDIKEVKTKESLKSVKANNKTVLEFTLIMEQLISSGLSIKDSLEILSIMDSRSNSSKLASSIFDIIKKGNSFADTVNDMSNYFPPVYRGLIKVGDRIGSVEKIFPRLRVFLENQKKIKEKLSNALLYPILVVVTAIIAFLVMIFVVFPKLKNMFAEFGSSAAIKLQSNITHIEIWVSILLSILFLILFTTLIVYRLSKISKKIKYKLDSFILKLPLLRRIVIYRDILNFAFAMEALTGSGIPIEFALQESEVVISNEVIKTALADIHKQILKGEALSSSFSKHKIFPDYLNKWILVGERSGKTEQIFIQIRKYYQAEIDNITTKFMSLIEPALIILIGIFLIMFIVTVIIPVFSMYGEII